MRRTLSFIGLAAGLTLALGLAGCGDDDGGGPCGNGVIDTAEGEVCDGSDLGGASCGSLGYNGGTLACAEDCTYDESGCNNDCGNNTVDPGEQCDGDDLNGETCESLGEEPGNLVCMNNCTFNTSQCGAPSVCGNGTIEGAEECDLFELGGEDCVSQGFAGGDLACTVNCTFNTVDCYNAAVMDVGGACEQDIECNGGLCLSEVAPDRHWGQAGGYCYEPCDQNGNCPLSGPDGVCVQFTSANFCMKECDLANPDCRPGQACEDIGGVGVCFWARCTADSECVITGDCETDNTAENFGWCVTPEENCSNGVDEDFDGRIDCSDPECTGETNCPIGEICGNGIDDDGDGEVDCDDGECIDLGICTGQICTPVSGATLTCGATLTGQANNATGSTDVIEGAECVDSETGTAGAYFSNEWGPEYTYTLTVTQPQEVTVTVSNYTGDLDVYIIKEVLGGCDPRRGCFAWGGEMAGVDEVINFTAYPGMNYYVVVDGYEGNESAFDISVACANSGYEDCESDGADNDGDGLVDCLDPECWGVGDCSTESDCSNGEDDDLDGAVDCFDNDCVADANCIPGTGYWELWERDGASGEFDMVGTTLYFTKDTSAQGYTVDATAQGTWLYAPGNGTVDSTVLTLTNNTVGERVDLPFNFDFDGQTYDYVYVIDNGYVSFINEGGWMPGPTGWNVYQFPRIGPLWTDLDPGTGTVTVDEYATFYVITWDGLPLDSGSATTPNQFQLVLHANGDIEMYWMAVDAVANQPLSTEGMVTIVGAEVGTPPPETNFVP